MTTEGCEMSLSKQMLRRLAHDETGSSLVEFAAALPLFVMMVMLGTATVLLVQTRFGVQAAAREAAMAGAHVSSNIEPFETAKEAATTVGYRVLQENELDPVYATLDFTGTDSSFARDTYFAVQISYDFGLPPWLAQWLNNDPTETIFTLSGLAVVPVQKHKARWPCPSPHPLCNS